ncbi:deoxynucleotidyltransferase terminal-interacting protein 2 [Sphaeramia orbicularis]|uniref:Fcf2 pre-rRNA processing C-terminal domain-containing protein n=1 Tax=Sphaeramia orbicularis TaxID=375764 RepID=A0A672ZSP7_9TELE|nr:deoxynucleotidyltransferase terminal-interacting protein 2 [Sphaeramia orbicularis]
MVSTRRGARVLPPSPTNPDQNPDVQATPSTGRRTRSTAKRAESPTQHALQETSSQLEKDMGGNPLNSSRKRCSRASRLHSPEQPSTPVGSVHEADVSDVESCCSAVSDVGPSVTSPRGRRRQLRGISQEDEEVSEVESCSSAVSASRGGQRVQPNSRRKKTSHGSDPAPAEVGEAKADQPVDTEFCSSVVSESQPVTRRKSTRTRSDARRQVEDSEVSDADCSGAGVTVSVSTTRRTTRSRRQIQPIPIHLEEDVTSEGSHSSAPTSRRTTAVRGKAAANVDVNEPPSCDSEGFESGPTYSRMRSGRSRSTGSKAGVDSDLESAVGSPCSARGGGTPCSSRTGSGNSSHIAPVSELSNKVLSVVLVRATEPGEEDGSLNDSRLENTVIAEDAESTLLEDESQAAEEKDEESVMCINLTSATDSGVTQEHEKSVLQKDTTTEKAEREMSVVTEEHPHISMPISDHLEDTVSEPAVMVGDQQEEPSAGNKVGDTSEMEMMQETVQSSEPLKPLQSVTVTTCDEASEVTKEEDEVMEVGNVDAHTSHREAPPGEDNCVEMSREEEKMEASILDREAQQVVDPSDWSLPVLEPLQTQDSIQVTSNQVHKITVQPVSEQQPQDVIVQNTKVISLLESDEDEDEDEDDDDDAEEQERDVCGGEEEEEEDEGAGPSKEPEVADESVAGLFMIDTRPGQEADEHYYKERVGEKEEEEEDEEFVDEEGDDEDDEDAEILFWSRNPQSKELSSRIDPGIRVKELGGLYINFDGSKSKPVSSSLQKLKEKKIQDEVMKKSVIGPDFEKKDAVPPYSESKQALKLKRRVERKKTTGDAWFNMKAPELTQELKADLQVLKMRGSMDPKRFYKKNDRDGFPKYFQVGTVVDNPVDFYHSRIPKKERKRTMVEELLADAEFRHNNKKKFQNIIAEKAAQGASKRKKHKLNKKKGM